MKTKTLAWIGAAAVLTVLAVGISTARGYLFAPNEPALQLPGIVETQEIRLSSKTGGRVGEILVQEGANATAGQPLIKLETPELQTRRTQLIAQQAAAKSRLEFLRNSPHPDDLAAAQAAFAVADSKLALLVAGSRVEEIEIAKLNVDERQSLEAMARGDRDRANKLRVSQAVSVAEYDEARTKLAAAESQTAIARQRWKILRDGTRPEELAVARAEAARLQAELQVVRRGPRQEQIAQAEAEVAEIGAKIDEVDVQREEAIVKAPSDCRIEVLAVRRGDMAAPSQPVVRVLCLQDVWVKTYVPETHLGLVRLNQAVTVTHDGSSQAYPGEIVQIASVSEFTPRNIQSVDERQNQLFAVKVRLANAASNEIFKPGMAAQVRLPLSTH